MVVIARTMLAGVGALLQGNLFRTAKPLSFLADKHGINIELSDECKLIRNMKSRYVVGVFYVNDVLSYVV